VSSAFVHGISTGNAGTTPISSNIQYIGPTVTLTVAANQKVFVDGNAALGSTGGASGLNLYICYGPGPTAVGLGIFGLTIPAGQRHTFGISAVVSGLSAGTYQFGMCGSASTTGWNNNEYAYINGMVIVN